MIDCTEPPFYASLRLVLSFSSFLLFAFALPVFLFFLFTPLFVP